MDAKIATQTDAEIAHIESVLRGISDDLADFGIAPREAAAPPQQRLLAAQRFPYPEIMLRDISPPPAQPAGPPIVIVTNLHLSQTYAAIVFLIEHAAPGANVIVAGIYALGTLRRLFPDITFHATQAQPSDIRAAADRIRSRHAATRLLFINFAWNAKQRTDSPLAYERKSRNMITLSEDIHTTIDAAASLFNFRTPIKIPYITGDDGKLRPADYNSHGPNVSFHWVKRHGQTSHIDGVNIVPPHIGMYEGLTIRIIERGAARVDVDNARYSKSIHEHNSTARPRGYDAFAAMKIREFYHAKFPRREWSGRIYAAPPPPSPPPQPQRVTEKKTWRSAQ